MCRWEIEGVGVDGGEMDRVMDEDDETTPARGARVVTTDGDEVVKWFESFDQKVGLVSWIQAIRTDLV